MTDRTNLDKMWENPGDEIVGAGDRDKKLVPFWSLDLSDNKELSKWKREFFRRTEEDLELRAEAWLDNKRMAMGEHFSPHRRRRSRVNTESETVKTKRKPFPVNITGELVEQKTSKVTANKVGVIAFPPNNSPRARNSSRIANNYMKYLDYIDKSDLLYERWQRAAFVFGEAYAWSDWNPAKGPVDPEQEEKLRDLIAEGEEPERVIIARDTDDDNRPIYASRVEYQGDVDTRVMYPWQVRWELGKQWEQADYCTIESRLYVDEVLALYDDLKLTDEEGNEVKIEELVEEDGRVPLTHLYHREHRFLALGRKITFVGDAVAENTIHPHNKDKFPIVRLTDIDIPSERYAMSFIENIKHLNRAFDGVMFLMLKALAHGAHPKWLMQRKSANHISLAGLATIVEYTGQIPPKLQTFPVLNSDMFNMISLLKETIRETAAVHDVSFGDVPKRLDSALAVQRLEDQETKRDRTSILKFREGVVEVNQNKIDIIGKHYDDDSDRLMKVVEQDETINTVTVQTSDLTGPFEMRIQGTGALAETVAGKTDRLVTLRKEFGPGVVPDALVIDALDVAQPDRYVAAATVALRKAEEENENFLSELEVQDPVKYEDLIAHWQTHMRLIQSSKFESLEKLIRKRVLEHVEGTESLMWEKTKTITGRGFSQKLQALDGWPALFTVPEPPPEAQAAGVPVPLQEGNSANQGNAQGPQVVPGQQPIAPPQPGEQAPVQQPQQ